MPKEINNQRICLTYISTTGQPIHRHIGSEAKLGRALSKIDDWNDELINNGFPKIKNIKHKCNRHCPFPFEYETIGE